MLFSNCRDNRFLVVAVSTKVSSEIEAGLVRSNPSQYQWAVTSRAWSAEIVDELETKRIDDSMITQRLYPAKSQAIPWN
jgi:hypothetical protein